MREVQCLPASQHGCSSVVSAFRATLHDIFYSAPSFPCGFIVCYEYKYQLAFARCTRVREEGGGGHDWNSSEPSGSNLDQSTEERGNGFRLLLFALALRFVWNETFSPHGPHSLSVDISVLTHSVSIELLTWYLHGALSWSYHSNTEHLCCWLS